MMKSELALFDGLDNRREIMAMLVRLGSDRARRRFLLSLIPLSLSGLATVPASIQGNCHPTAAYFTMVSICNEVGVSINVAALKLLEEVRKL
jgi:hypothetical protein